MWYVASPPPVIVFELEDEEPRDGAMFGTFSAATDDARVAAEVMVALGMAAPAGSCYRALVPAYFAEESM